MTDSVAAPTGFAALKASISSIGIALGTLVHARAELMVVELHEERQRLRQECILIVLGALFLAIGMLLLALLVVVLCWDTHRVLAIIGMTALNLSIGGGLLLRLRWLSQASTPPFSATLAEFANDLAALGALRSAEGDQRGT